MTPAGAAARIGHRDILRLAVPMMAANATTPLLGLVGITAVGRLGDASLMGAVALGGVAFDFILWTFGALRMATVGLTAQAVGRGETEALDAITARALVVAVAVGVALVALQVPLGRAAAAVAGASPAVTEGLLAYIGIRIWASPFALVNYVVLGSVLGRARTDLGLLLQLAINGANIALTVLLVNGLGLAIAGAAAAAVVAEGVGALLGLLVLHRLGARPGRVPWSRLADRDGLLRMLAVNRDIMIRTMLLVVGYALFAALGARAGDVVLAANAVLQNIWLTAGYVLDGFATAGETLCGQAVGRRDAAGFGRAVRLSLLWCFGFGLALSGLCLAAGGAFVDLVTTSPEVREEARRYLPYAGLVPLASAAAFTFDGVFIGATWTRAMRNLMIAAFLAYAAVLGLARPAGNAGLWIAMLAFLAARGLGQALLYPSLRRQTFAT